MEEQYLEIEVLVDGYLNVVNIPTFGCLQDTVVKAPTVALQVLYQQPDRPEEK